MLDDLGAIIERLLAKTLTDSDIQVLYQLLQRNINQDVLQSGRFNVAIGAGQDIQVGDSYAGATPEQIRLIVRELVQELKALQPTRSGLSSNVEKGDESVSDDPPFRKLTLDPTTVKAINTRLEIILEISKAGYLSESHQAELRRFKQQLQTFNNLNETLQNIAEQSDRLIQEAIAVMRLQLEALKLSGRELTEETCLGSSLTEQECQQAETMIFQTFVERLEDSRGGADWISKNMDLLINYASKNVLSHFPNLNASEKDVDDFKFSLKQFLEQVNFCLYWGNYDILDSPNISLVLGIEQYEIAFQAMKEAISKRLRSETIHEIEACLDYLTDRLQFY